MDLGQIQTDLDTWVTTLSGLPVEWGRQPSKIYTSAFVLAYPGPIVKIGHDFPTYTHDTLTDQLVERMYGNRRMTLRLSFRSFDQRWGTSARHYAEQFRVKTQSTERSTPLMGLACLSDTGELVENDYEWSGRMVSQVDMDVTLGLWGYELNPTYDAGYIRHANIEGQGHVIDEMGNPVEDESGDPVIVEEVITINVTTE